MKIDVIAKVEEVRAEDLKNKTVIVIDVLRSTSSIVTALACGAREVIAVETIGQAKQYRGDSFLFAGERFCRPIPGFPLTNSPTELTTSPIAEKSIVLTTTNGTRAIQKSVKAANVLIGSFLNGFATAKLAAELHRHTTILCAGSSQAFALEDGLAAGYIISQMTPLMTRAVINDFGLAMVAAFEYYKDDLATVLAKTMMGKKLTKIGLIEDITFCAQKNQYPIVPTANETRIKLYFSQEKEKA